MFRYASIRACGQQLLVCVALVHPLMKILDLSSLLNRRSVLRLSSSGLRSHSARPGGGGGADRKLDHGRAEAGSHFMRLQQAWEMRAMIISQESSTVHPVTDGPSVQGDAAACPRRAVARWVLRLPRYQCGCASQPSQPC
eukprot:1422712-Rhodomonas_salina.1